VAQSVNTEPRFELGLLRPKYWLTWLALLLAVPLAFLPAAVRWQMASWIGGYMFKHNAKRRHIVRENLRLALPDNSDGHLNEQALKHFSWHAFALLEYPVFFFRSKTYLQSRAEVKGLETLKAHQEAGEPVILLLLHSVMLEFAAVALSPHCKTFGSYKRSKNEVLNWLIARSRRRYVDAVVSREEGFRPLIRLMQSKRLMLFLPDEDLGIENGVFAEFYGRQKATLTTPARLCRLAKARALVAFTTFDMANQKYQLSLQSLPEGYPQTDVSASASTMNQAFESAIESDPMQYMWTLKLFKTVAPGDKFIY